MNQACRLHAAILVLVCGLSIASARAADTAGASGATSAPAALGPRHHEPIGGFSFCPPKGWAIRDMPGMKYKYAIFIAEGYTPLMSVVDEETADSLEVFTSTYLKSIKHNFPDLTDITTSDLLTTSGLKGSRHVVTVTQQGKLLRQSLFFIDGGNGTKYLFKGSALAKDGDSRDAGFLASAQSFQLDLPAAKPADKTPDKTP